ncbi:hypothetical protein [Thermoanaerobacterium thermosaccharolyticum]|uniref:hypothetical protein n=1 Tax=Thermoanaerobacterium thermosaccharolyticum TaxID=1517 RepID=UPI003DA8BEA3
MSWFDSCSETKKLVQEQCKVFEAMGMNHKEALKLANEIVNKAVENCKTAGVYGKEPNPLFLYEEAKYNLDYKDYIEVIKKDGVTDEDIQEWHGLSYLERAVIDVSDYMSRFTAYIYYLDKGYNSEKAAREVRHKYPIWGDPRQKDKYLTPLPWELKLREIRWKEKYYNNPYALEEKIRQYLTYNAMIRAAIKEGEL